MNAILLILNCDNQQPYKNWEIEINLNNGEWKDNIHVFRPIYWDKELNGMTKINTITIAYYKCYGMPIISTWVN